LSARGREKTRRSTGEAGLYPGRNRRGGAGEDFVREGTRRSAKKREGAPGKPASPPTPNRPGADGEEVLSAKAREESLKPGKRAPVSREGITGENAGFHGGRGGRTKKDRGEVLSAKEREGTRKGAGKRPRGGGDLSAKERERTRRSAGEPAPPSALSPARGGRGEILSAKEREGAPGSGRENACRTII
jgi:hypothetical protein